MPLSERHYPVLVTGAAGLLGHALSARLAASAPRPDALHLTDAAELDVTNSGAVTDAVRTIRPHTVFHLAAWTDVDGAEAHPQEARRLNVEAAETVARAAADAGALVVHMSTDFIFDGTKPGLYVEDDPPSPQSVYARTKAEAEACVRAAAPDGHLIVRTAWLYGAGRRDFLDVILSCARAGEPLRVVTDQVGCPTWNEDLAEALVAMVESGARGTLHACGRGEASRWDLAVEALRAAGFDASPERVTTADMPRPARRPARAVLSVARLAETVGFRFPPWQESVREYIKSMGA
ncbi:MAG TPA: dTDP-4-dehydrorhamnose reductase [Phycisphaerae bacterium]|nr:dTDP-4-dehydrorhamnose reductase [Phycisphaerae bacterium]